MSQASSSTPKPTRRTGIAGKIAGYVLLLVAVFLFVASAALYQLGRGAHEIAFNLQLKKDTLQTAGQNSEAWKLQKDTGAMDATANERATEGHAAVGGGVVLLLLGICLIATKPRRPSAA